MIHQVFFLKRYISITPCQDLAEVQDTLFSKRDVTVY